MAFRATPTRNPAGLKAGGKARNLLIRLGRSLAAGSDFFVARAREGLRALVCALALAGGAFAAGEQKLHLEVFIEGHSTKLIAEFLRGTDGRFSARRSELREVGVVVPGQGKDEDIVLLESIPGLGMRYDESAQKLHLTLAAGARLAREYTAGAAASELRLKPNVEVSRDFGAVLNYNLFGTAARGYGSGSKVFQTGSAMLDGRVTSPYGNFQSSGIAGTTLTREGLLRLETSYVYAHRETSTVATIGDAISGGLNWTRPMRFAGVQISRQFGLRPDIITAPLPSVSGSAAVPSTVDVYVDNIRIATQEVGSGPFRISNLPVPGEAGTARVVVRDVSGRETVTTMPFFTSAKLLSSGTVDFSLDGGLPRQSYAIRSFDYTRRPFGMGSSRYGLNDWLTLEGHGETTAGLIGGGIGATIGAGKLGLVSVAGAASRHAGETGVLASASWQIGLRGVFVGLGTQRTFGAYEDVASVTARRTPLNPNSNLADSGFYALNVSPKVARAIDRATLGVPFPSLNSSLSLSFVNIERADRETSRLLSMTYSQTFAKTYNTFVSGYWDFANRQKAGVIAGVSFIWGQNLIAQSAASLTREARQASFELSRPMTQKEHDYSWRLQTSEGTNPVRGAAASYRSPWFQASAGVRQEGALMGGFGELDGALIAAPSGIFVTRRVQDAFAIVDVGAPGVEVLHENRVVGRTGLRGVLVVPDVQSFQRSKIAISPETLPGEQHADITETDIIPGFRGAATVSIKAIAQKNSARIELRDVTGQFLTAGTQLTHEESGQMYTIGYDGLTYLPEIGEQNTLIVRDGLKECRVRFSRSERDARNGGSLPLTCR